MLPTLSGDVRREHFPFRKRSAMTSIRAALVILLSGVCGAVAGAEPAGDPPWRYTFEKPGPSWAEEGFDDSGWRQGPGGFGDGKAPQSRIGTEWTTDDIWIRRTIELPAPCAEPALYVHHDDDAEVFINGRLVASLPGSLSAYRVVPLDGSARDAIRPGKNTIAAHCREKRGGQFIDVHVIDTTRIPVLPQPEATKRLFMSDLVTRWAATVTPANAWPDYPRPQFVRDAWTNLNGSWDYRITPRRQEAIPETWEGTILVPFCLESRLGGVRRPLSDADALWYRRTFTATPAAGRRTLLNFEAVDYRCRVFVNGTPVGEHTGGNTPFSVDATPALRAGVNELVVRIEDDTEGMQLRGKQSVSPVGIYYTRVSGIWQTVWLETVPENRLASVAITTDAARGTITVRPTVAGAAGGRLRVRATLAGAAAGAADGPVSEPVTITVAEPRLWSPAHPHLYDLVLELVGDDGTVLDRVASYAGIRTVGKERDEAGHLRFTLNGKPIFHWGTLDQGWWPDGLLTPPSDAAMRSDIEYLKAAGFNMIRKHVKVEPRRYYAHCDRIGMLVWQDQVSGGLQPAWKLLAADPPEARWSDEDHAQFIRELDAMVTSLENHPSIVVWTPFNEAWGQHRTVAVGRWLAHRDPTRAVNVASGGNFFPAGDVVDFHAYPHPSFPFDPARYRDFIHVVGEFGGHGLPVAGHLWDGGAGNWGYGGLPKDPAEYAARYKESIEKLAALKDKGIAAGVYTQTSDVEAEINGLLTYDRAQAKIPAAELRELHRPLGLE
jgi:beta-galactosidase